MGPPSPWVPPLELPVNWKIGTRGDRRILTRYAERAGPPAFYLINMNKALQTFISLCPDVESPTSGTKAVSYASRGRCGSGGRNNLGKITIRRRGGGHKRRFLTVDFSGEVGKHSK